MPLLRGWRWKSPEDQSRLIEDYSVVFGSIEGKRVLADLLDQSEFYQAVDSEASALTLAQHNGKRAVLQHVLTRLGASPDYRRDLMAAVVAQREKERSDG